MATKKAKPSAATVQSSADFIYCGRRGAVGGGMLVVIKVEQADGTWGPELTYEYTASTWLRRQIGGIYTGAKFSDTQALGLNLATYAAKEGATPEERWTWRSLDAAAVRSSKLAKLEENKKRTHEVDVILLPLRKTLAGIFSQYERRAFEDYVLMRLRTPPRSDE